MILIITRPILHTTLNSCQHYFLKYINFVLLYILQLAQKPYIKRFPRREGMMFKLFENTKFE